MAIDIKINQHNDYLEFVVTGSYDLNEAVEKFTHILNSCKFAELSKALIDVRELQGHGGGVEKSLYGIGVENLYIEYLKSGGHELQIAYLRPVTDYEPGMIIAERSGYQFKLFDKLSEALEWLNVSSK
ncbi:MAG: hypothetical protein GY760_00575 [Deltaproteobacteria bacterium]|nr:hypothetical protein [Deltaproteobacteria bacterium]